MYDMHYDLLTILYFNFKENNPKRNLTKLIEDCTKMYKNNNITGGIINLYFESIDEMKEELGIEEYELNVTTMLKISVNYLNEMKRKGIIPNNIDYIYSIEGCDFLKNINELDKLYKLGVRSILPVWNNKNKFGSGNRSEDGLTNLGVDLINKARSLNMIIDVSHANEKTFYDILNIIDNKTNLIASHSNVRTLCDRNRNLNDNQLKELKNKNGYIGLFTNGNFLSLDNRNLDKQQRVNNYLKHLDYIINNIGFDIDKILLSTDNMDFAPDKSYHNLGICNYEETFDVIYNAISNKYDTEVADLITIDNAKRLIKKVK